MNALHLKKGATSHSAYDTARAARLSRPVDLRIACVRKPRGTASRSRSPSGKARDDVLLGQDVTDDAIKQRRMSSARGAQRHVRGRDHAASAVLPRPRARHGAGADRAGGESRQTRRGARRLSGDVPPGYRRGSRAFAGRRHELIAKIHGLAGDAIASAPTTRPVATSPSERSSTSPASTDRPRARADALRRGRVIGANGRI